MTLYARRTRVSDRQRRIFRNTLLARERELKAARDRLDNDVALLDTVALELGYRPRDERVDDLLIPARVHNGDAQRGAVNLRWHSGSKAEGIA